MDPLLHEKLDAEIAKPLAHAVKDCLEQVDPDTLRAAASRMEAIFTDHFQHAHFDADTRAFNTFLKDLRRSIASLTD